jgi:hypothetical protein
VVVAANRARYWVLKLTQLGSPQHGAKPTFLRAAAGIGGLLLRTEKPSVLQLGSASTRNKPTFLRRPLESASGLLLEPKPLLGSQINAAGVASTRAKPSFLREPLESVRWSRLNTGSYISEERPLELVSDLLHGNALNWASTTQMGIPVEYTGMYFKIDASIFIKTVNSGHVDEHYVCL